MSTSMQRIVELNLQRRNPETGEIVTVVKRADPRRIGVVAMDVWDYHWCMTFAERAGALVLRMNAALDGLRQLGMQVIFTPTNAIEPYEDTPQRRAVKAMSDHPWPEVRDLDFPQSDSQSEHPCDCGPGMPCLCHFGLHGMNPNLRIDQRDLIAWGTREMYNISQERGLTYLIYTGFATNICVMGKPDAVGAMLRLGLNVIVSRDLTDAFGYPPERTQQETLARMERHLCPTIDVCQLLQKDGLWDDSQALDPVLISPWGKPNRPYLFEGSVSVHLSQPRVVGAEIRYTLDGSSPSADSPRYDQPVEIRDTTDLWAVSFLDGRPVGLSSKAYYAKMPPKPPRPDLRLWEIEPLTVVDGSLPDDEWRVPVRTWGMSIRGETYFRGLTMHAPAEIVYELRPEYQRFVALVGVDDTVLGRYRGLLLAQYPSVLFQVYIDDVLVAESPVLRISQGPWPFDVAIQQGSKRICLVVADAGDGNRLDIGNWAEVGFIIPNYRGPRNLP